MPRNKRLHFKDLNALRALAFVPIFLFSYLFVFNSGGNEILTEITTLVEALSRNSLDFFFFLSAFLITSHALREYKYTETFLLRNFYIRRLLRMVVVMTVLLVFAFLIHPWLIRVLDLQEVIHPRKSVFLSFIPNYLFDSFSRDLIYIPVLVTFYMFLQFFIFWGIILKFLARQIIVVCLILILVGILVRGIHFYQESIYLFDTLSYATPIGIGGLLAYAIRNDLPFLERLKDMSKKMNYLIYTTGLFLLLFTYPFLQTSIVGIFIPLLTGILFAYVVIDQTFGKNSFIQLKNAKALSFLGKISFGLIAYQSIFAVVIIIALQSLDYDSESLMNMGVMMVLGIVSTVIFANVSYKLLEKVLLRIRRNFKKV